MRRLALLALVAIVAPIHAQQQWGSLTGKVTLDGKIPAKVSLVPEMMRSPHAKILLAAPDHQKVKQTWVTDPKTKGVANVFVFLKAKAGQAFPIAAADKVRKDPAVVDQPFCVFEPHVIAHYPSYFDGEKQVPTGEKFFVRNSAPVPNSVRGMPAFKSGSRAFNLIVSPGDEIEVKLNPHSRPFPLESNLHGWNNAHVMVFDHPYFAITKADGAFTIPRVPAGMTVTLQGWHEDIGWLLTTDGRPMDLRAGANELNFSIKAP